MTEAEWLACTDPRRMLFYLFCNCNRPAVRAYYSAEVGLIEPDGRHLEVGERKPRLFYCACCRRALPLAPESDIAGPVEVGERLADGLSTDGEWGAARQSARAAVERCRSARRAVDTWVALAVSSCLEEVWTGGIDSVTQAALAVSEAKHVAPVDGDLPLDRAELGEQANLLRCIFGPLPFRSLTIDPAWLAWNGGTAVRLARGVYEGRELPSGTLGPARMAVLADALEDAGCADPELLGHLRGPGPHVRGCWALDLLLGKG